MALLEVMGLGRRYRNVRAVDDVSFTLEAGQVMGFIGPNGAGKSTTLRMLATLELPTEGSFTLNGEDAVEHPDDVRPAIGYMPDRYGTYADTTVLEFLDFFARAYGLKGAARRERMESVMAFTGLEDLRHKLTSDLSKGMKQRVALARTLLHDPKLLLLDEPADGLDPRARIELRELLRALAEQGKAVLISSHILTELAEVCDSCAIIERGKLLAVGSVADVLARSQVELGGQRELVFRFCAPGISEGAVERVLLVEPGVTRVVVSGLEARVRLKLEEATQTSSGTGSVEQISARLIRALVTAQLPVCGAESPRADLEDVFMRVTQGRVS